MNPERINIKDLTIEQPESQEGLSFNPDRDLSEEDWEKVFSAIERDNKGMTGGKSKLSEKKNYLELYPSIKILGKDIGLPPESFMYFAEKFIDGSRKNENWRKFLQHVSELAILGYPLELSEKEKENVLSLLDLDEDSDARNSPNTQEFIITAALCRIVGLPVEISKEKWEEIDKEIDNGLEKSPPYSWLAVLAAQKVCGRQVDIQDYTWQIWKKLLHSDREHLAPYNVKVFLERARNMAIVGAEKVTIPEKGGLQLTFPHESDVVPEVKTPSLPEKRNF